MKLVARHTRASPVALAFLLFATRVSAADTSAPELAKELDVHLGDRAQPVLDVTEKLRTASVPVDALRSKLREGVAKRIPAQRIAEALVLLGQRMLWTTALLQTCEPTLPSEHIAGLRCLSIDVLASGVSEEELRPVLNNLCGRNEPVASLRMSVETYLHLSQVLSASQRPSWAFAAEFANRELSAGAVNRLVSTLREIRQRRGSLENALERATSRLRAGASATSVRNELRERFLR